MKDYRVLSLFDGISCGQAALNRVLRNRPYSWFASEVDKRAMAITQHNFPNTLQVGDVRSLEWYTFKPIDIIMGGSPCQDFSVAGNKEGMFDIVSLDQYMKLRKENFKFKGESYLFWEFVRLVKEINPTYFLLENTKMAKKWEDIITNALGVEPIRINSSLVSAQSRDRFYWTNIPNVTIPEDRFIYIDDIIPGARNGYGYGGVKNKITGKYEYPWTERKDHKAGCLVKNGGNRDYVRFDDNTHRKITLTERELLQTLPAGYTDVPGVSTTARKEGIGNGWTVDVIEHILSHIPNIQPNELYHREVESFGADY